jgi:hypothetical protein
MSAPLVPPCPKCHHIDKVEEEGARAPFGPWYTCRRCEQVYVAPPRLTESDVATKVTLWKARWVECVVVHHWDAQSYEIQIIEKGHVADRRWFDNPEDATEFAIQCAQGSGTDAI